MGVACQAAMCGLNRSQVVVLGHVGGGRGCTPWCSVCWQTKASRLVQDRTWEWVVDDAQFFFVGMAGRGPVGGGPGHGGRFWGTMMSLQRVAAIVCLVGWCESMVECLVELVEWLAR